MRCSHALHDGFTYSGCECVLVSASISRNPIQPLPPASVIDLSCRIMRSISVTSRGRPKIDVSMRLLWWCLEPWNQALGRIALSQGEQGCVWPWLAATFHRQLKGSGCLLVQVICHVIGWCLANVCFPPQHIKHIFNYICIVFYDH